MKKLRKANSTKSVDFLNSKEKSVREVYTSKFSALARYIKRYVEHPGFKQNEIADKLEMNESQVSLWLSGMHNLTLKSILKLESASNIQILNPAIWGNENSNTTTTAVEIPKANKTFVLDNYEINGSVSEESKQDYFIKYGPVVGLYVSIVGGVSTDGIRAKISKFETVNQYG